MKTLIAMLVASAALGATACKKEAEMEPCERASKNVGRLQAAEGITDGARQPLDFAEHCETARLSASELDCISYASSWREAQECSPRVFRDLTVSR